MNFEIKFVDAWLEHEIVELYKTGGWWKDTYDPSGIRPLIKGSFAFAIVIDKSSGNAIGMGRILSDGVSDAYIQDLIVLPKFRGQGIGKKLVKFLLDHCISNGIQWIGLIAEPGQDSFYSKIDFSPMKNHIPMKYKIRD
jgi:ribosomal protein S18 acetylase RimI-like enzyme